MIACQDSVVFRFPVRDETLMEGAGFFGILAEKLPFPLIFQNYFVKLTS